LCVLPGCDPQNSSWREPATSYSFPTAVIGIRVSNTGSVKKLHRIVNRFGRDNNLHWYRHPLSSAEDCVIHPEMCADHYGPEYPRAKRGFSLALNAYPSKCFLIQFSERSTSWKLKSLQKLDELMTLLTNELGPEVELLVRPKSTQNWPEQLSHKDPERPVYLKELCPKLRVIS
jgi:hypothetical protein